MTNIPNPKEFATHFFDLVDKSTNILITSHINPDDDSISSVLSTYYVINKKFENKNIKIRYSSEFNERWNYFENFDKIQRVDDIADSINDFDLVIYLDGAQYSRFSKNTDALKNFKGDSVCIDHHSSPFDGFNLTYIKPGMTSTAESLFDIFCDYKEKIDQRFAEVLMLGILGDTGTFQFIAPNQVEVFDVVQKLILDGEINIQDFKAKFTQYPEKTFKLIQKVIANIGIKEIKGWPKFLYSFIDRATVLKEGYSYTEASEAAQLAVHGYSRAIKGVTWGFVIYPSENGGYKISLRSLPGSVNVRLLVESLEIGGGHDRAAGGTFKSENELSYDEVLNRLFDWMKKNKPTL